MLPSTYEYEFIDGEERADPPFGLDLIYPGPYLQYASCADAIDRALAYLEEVINEEGPFDGVIGFSQGAACAARLLLHCQKADPNACPPFKVAIFLCTASLFYGNVQEYNMSMEIVSDLAISIPTVHVIGKSDPHRPFGLDLIKLCDPKLCGVVDHQMGHEIPKDAVVTSKILKVIESAVRSTQTGY